MKINSNTSLSTARPTGAPPAPAAQPAAAPAAADSVQVGAEPPALTQARTLMQEAMQLRSQVGQEFVGNVLPQTPKEFKSILEASEPILTQSAQEAAQQGMVVDQFWMIATETRQLSQAGVNAEARAEFQEKSNQKADRAALLREEIGFQTQADLLLQAFPEQASAALQKPAEGEALMSGGTFVNEVYKNIPADQAKAIQEAAAFSPLAQVVAAKPELVEKAAGTLAQAGQTLLGVTQGCGMYMAFIQQQVLPREMQAGQLLATLQPQQ